MLKPQIDVYMACDRPFEEYDTIRAQCSRVTCSSPSAAMRPMDINISRRHSSRARQLSCARKRPKARLP